MSRNNKKFIISLGGSLIVPDQIDIVFLRQFKKLLTQEAKQGQSFILAPGGGRTARKYAAAAKTLGDLNHDSLDWLGIYSIRLNSLLLSSIFRFAKNIKVMKMIEAKPGRSSDYDAVVFAKRYKAKTIINITNIDFVYDKNPKKHKNAKPIKNITWKEFIKIVGNKWDPGSNLPFDPVASKLAEKLKLKVIILNGKNLSNLKNVLDEKPFIGTIIS